MLARNLLAPWSVRVAVCVLALAFLLQALASMWDDAPTFDELVSPAVGYAELFTGDFRLVPDHPPLIRILTSLPLLPFQSVVPLHHDSWQRKDKAGRSRYTFAEQFFYVANGEADRMMFWSRIPVVGLSLLLGLLVFQWAKDLYGTAAGLLAFFLYAFEPNIMAHSRLATNDLIITLLIFATVFEFWRYRRAPSMTSLILTGLLLGFALLSKFSAIMLFPMLVVLAFFAPPIPVFKRLASALVTPTKRSSIRPAIGLAFITAVSTFVVASVVVAAFYNIQWWLFIEGVLHAVTHYRGDQLATRGHPAYLMGELSTHGWWYYFPVAFLTKTPIPLLIYILASLIFLSFWKNEAKYFLLIPIVTIISGGLASQLNIGLRHILPAYPFLIVLASRVVTIRFSRPRFFAATFCALGVWYMVSTLKIFPSYLAYFNEFVGPENGYKILVDSNLDWGQDLKRLKQFMKENGIPEIYLSYFGTANPCYYGIKFLPLPDSYPNCSGQPKVFSPSFVAVSATNLQSVYLSSKSYDWLKIYKPIAQIGYSIFIYDIRGNGRAHNELGILFQQYGALRQAVQEFKLVTELDPNQPVPYANLGIAYSFLSEFGKADESFRKALELDPDNRMAREGLELVRKQARAGSAGSFTLKQESPKASF